MKRLVRIELIVIKNIMKKILLNRKLKYLDNLLNKKFYCEACDFAAGI